MRLTLAALVLALAACGPADREAAANTTPPAATPGPATPAADAQENGTFRIQKGDSTIVTVRFQRTPARLHSEVFGDPAKGRVTYTADLNPDATVSRMQIQAFAGAGAEPRARANLQFRGDSAIVESVQDGETQTARAGAPAGVIPIPVSEALDMMEQVLRRARARGGSTVEVPVVALEGGAKVGAATVTFTGSDSARIQFRFEGSSSELVAATDATGRLLGGRIPQQGLTIRRD